MFLCYLLNFQSCKKAVNVHGRPPNTNLTASIEFLLYPLTPIPPNILLLYTCTSSSDCNDIKSVFINSDGAIFQSSSKLYV